MNSKSLPYDAGNLLKHGRIAEFVRWQCDQPECGDTPPVSTGLADCRFTPRIARIAKQKTQRWFVLNRNPENLRR